MSASQDLLAVEYEASEGWTPAPARTRLPISPAERLEQSGPMALADFEALSILARCRVEDAAGLIAAFGTLGEALAQPQADLARHVSAGAARRIRLLHDVMARALRGPLQRRPVLSSWSAVVAYLKVVLSGAAREQVRVLFLDKKNQLIADEVMGTGTVVCHASEPVQTIHIAQVARQLRDHLPMKQGLDLIR